MSDVDEVRNLMLLEAASVARETAIWTALLLMRSHGRADRALELNADITGAVDIDEAEYDLDVRPIAAQAIREAAAIYELEDGA